MKLRKRFLAIAGATMLVASSMLTGHVSAQDSIGTTLTVETSVPACEDLLPSSASIRDAEQFVPFSGLVPADPNAMYEATQAGSSNVDYYINTCHDTTWSVSVSISDFDSGTHVLPSSGNIRIRGTSGFTGVYQGGSTGPALTNGVQSHMTTAYKVYEGEPILIGSGTATNPPHPTIPSFKGGFTQFIQVNMINIPGTTPPGTYVADLTATLIVNAP